VRKKRNTKGQNYNLTNGQANVYLLLLLTGNRQKKENEKSNKYLIM
jgi:hypothetical protein